MCEEEVAVGMFCLKKFEVIGDFIIVLNYKFNNQNIAILINKEMQLINSK